MRRIPAAALVLLLFAPTVGAHPSRLAGGRLASDIETWRGLMVFAEYRCSPYDREADYPYSRSLEQEIAANLGGWWSPYDGTPFPNEESDIEHVVAVSEAHDSGLCAADAGTRRRFASDLDNLTLATPALNRYEKVARDAADWFPEHNRCWFAGRVLAVKLEYGLSVDPQEAAALEAVLKGCSIEHVLRPYRPPPPETTE